ncbi:ankyrin repeat family protein, partial [Tanacetum coccineum]
TNKRGALHCAAREGQLQVCNYLLEDLNLDVNTKDEDGRIYVADVLQYVADNVLKANSESPDKERASKDAVESPYMGTIRSKGITRLLLLGALDIIEGTSDKIWEGYVDFESNSWPHISATAKSRPSDRLTAHEDLRWRPVSVETNVAKIASR